jgi:hypothetical protein
MIASLKVLGVEGMADDLTVDALGGAGNELGGGERGNSDELGGVGGVDSDDLGGGSGAAPEQAGRTSGG